MAVRYGKRSIVAQLERRTKMQTKVLLQVVGRQLVYEHALARASLLLESHSAHIAAVLGLLNVAELVLVNDDGSEGAGGVGGVGGAGGVKETLN